MKIDHICVLVKDFDKAVNKFKEILQADDDHISIFRDLNDSGDIIDCANVWGGEACIEVITPHSKESPLYRFMEKRGEGIHHVGITTQEKNMGKEMDRLEALGLELIEETPRLDRFGIYYTFSRPKSCFGVMMEFDSDYYRTGPTTVKVADGVVPPTRSKK
jgi:methylmalonyl-CoA/ethylmalonyl-CoA epimerase